MSAHSSNIVVYIPNSEPFADSKGSVHVARVIERQKYWITVQLLTDRSGSYHESKGATLLAEEYEVSNRQPRDIQPRTFYQFAAYTAAGIQTPLTASGFVQTKSIEKPLSSTTRNGLGSGLYGTYVVGDIHKYQSNPGQTVYKIDCPYAYPLQDAEHGDSLTNASLQTNRYLERIFEIVRADNDASNQAIADLMAANPLTNIVMLWNLCLFRTGDAITADGLHRVLAKYVSHYFTGVPLVDSVTGEFLQEQPINSILKYLGYNGIIADDADNNGWDGGCVCYSYNTADLVQGSTTPYSTGDVDMNGSK